VLTAAIADHDARAALELVARIASQGADLRRFAAEAVGFFRGVFLAHYAPKLAEVTDEPPQVVDAWKKAAGSLPAVDVLRAVDVLGEALIKLREGREERLMLELALIKLTRPETAADPAALASRLERIERRMAAAPMAAAGQGGVPPSPAPVPAAPVPDRPASGGPPPAMPVESPAAAPAGTAPISFEQFRTIWPALFGGLREVLGARRFALFRHTEPGGVEGATLIIDVQHDFHLQALGSDPAVAAIVATKAGDLLGVPVAVAFRAAGSDAGVAAEEPLDRIEFEKDRLLEAPADLADPLKLVAEELGGEVVEEFEADDRA
jgi:hypothetical protein